MAEYWIKTGDTLPRIESTLTDGNDDPFDIAQADVYFTLRPIRAVTPVIELAVATNDQIGDGSDGTLGQVHYDWEIGDTDVAGGYYADWRVVFVNNEVMTFPNNGHDTIAIVDALEASGS